MAFPTAVNNQVTDSVSQTNAQVLGVSPVTAMGNLFMAVSQALANAAHNATYSQQQTNMTAQAATIMGIVTLYSINIASGAAGTRRILK